MQSFREICRSIRTPWHLCCLIGTTSALLSSIRGCDCCSSVTGNQPTARAVGLLASPATNGGLCKNSLANFRGVIRPAGGLIAAHFGFNTYGDFDMNNKLLWISLLLLAPLGCFANCRVWYRTGGCKHFRCTAICTGGQPLSQRLTMDRSMFASSRARCPAGQSADQEQHRPRTAHSVARRIRCVPVLAQLDRNQGLGMGMGGPSRRWWCNARCRRWRQPGSAGVRTGFRTGPGFGQGLGQGRQGFGMQGNQFGGMRRDRA